MEHIPTQQDIIAAHERISPYVPRSPIFISEAINRAMGFKAFFHMECLMPEVGSFKLRGAANAILSLSDEERSRGIVTQSTGNHALAVAYMAAQQKIQATIVMAAGASEAKKRRVRAHGGRILECSSAGFEARTQMLREEKERTGAIEIHPFDHYRVIAGQATVAKQLMEDVPNIDAMIAPIGGGGLVAGIALWAKYHSPRTKVIAAEPAAVDDASRSLQMGSIQQNPSSAKTVADGLVTPLGSRPFGIIKENVPDIVCVTEEEILSAMRIIWECLRVTVEPSGAVAYAALLKKREQYAGQNIGVILSGGNVDLDHIPFLQQ